MDIVLSFALKAIGVCFLLLLMKGLGWLLSTMIIAPFFDPLGNLPGPEGRLLQSHLPEAMDPSLSPNTHENWQNQYGKTFRFHGFGQHDYRLMSFDFAVLNRVLTSPVYEKPWQTRALLSRLVGRGIFSMEGIEHKCQRRLIGPAFSSQKLKRMMPIFFQRARILCDRWATMIPESPETQTNENVSGTKSSYPRGAQLDVAHWISRAAFDVIGLAGFDYQFNALDNEFEEVYSAYRRMFDVADKGPELRGILELYFPIIRRLWPNTGTKVTNECLVTIEKAGKRLIEAKTSTVRAAEADSEHVLQNDILSVLIRANLSTSLVKKLSDSELLDQCSTFLFAGSDSVSLAVSWCLYFLSHHKEIQTRLREELLPFSHAESPPIVSSGIQIDENSDGEGFSPSSSPRLQSKALCLETFWNDIESLPYLDSVVRETLRLCPPVHGTIRVATADDLLPVSHPVVHRDGTVVSKGGFIKIRKGSYVHIPIEGLNLSEEIWGHDARRFNPDRWTSGKSFPGFPGLGHIMTFSFGPHSCLGHRFAINEMKAFLSTILLRFTFSPIDGFEIRKFNSILTRPYIKGRREKGTQLPLVVSHFTS